MTTKTYTVEIPDNATSVKVVYNLTGGPYGANGNMGMADSIQEGQDPFMNGKISIQNI
jgi:hypothetical protein